jgi:hypothetical protein
VYAGEGRWDATMEPNCRVPAIAADNQPDDDDHISDTSVICKNGRFYMACTIRLLIRPWSSMKG